MTRKLYLASKNSKKLKELKSLLGNSWQVCLAGELGEDLSWEENGVTFEENARIKAQAVRRFAPDGCVLADDSGLEVEALGGRPGVFSARFAGEGASDAQNNAKLLAKLEDVPRANRSARFVCCLCFIDEEGRESLYRGECHGWIRTSFAGTSGFGYDPLFEVDLGDSERLPTMAELDPEVKNRVSHRGKAMRLFLEEHALFTHGDHKS